MVVPAQTTALAADRFRATAGTNRGVHTTISRVGTKEKRNPEEEHREMYFTESDRWSIQLNIVHIDCHRISRIWDNDLS